jgi:hypothetical protein
MYSTTEQEALATELGFELFRCIDKGDIYSQGERQIWSCRSGWQTADLIDNRYQNHKLFERLEDALRRLL